MKCKSSVLRIVVCLLLISCNSDLKNDWEIADNPLLTEWSKKVNPRQPWSEYPRPMMQRTKWINLNGLWEYTITGKGEKPVEWNGKILVPYPVESALSGVGERITENQTLWYRTDFIIPGSWSGKSTILNFEASDWETTVWIDGIDVGIHRGGYDPFSFDISEFIEAGKIHELKVSVWDPTDKGPQARGKQVSNPRGIWYTPVSGIWQTVWLEPVNTVYIKSFRITTNIESGQINLKPEIENLKDGIETELKVRLRGRLIGETTAKMDAEVVIEVDDFLLWSPASPVLYDLELCLLENGKIVDRIKSHAGFRKVSLGKTSDGFTRILINNDFLYQNGPLDQGFWPDGIYTPPSEKAMIYDLDMTRKMGFNMLRKHVKIENRRFYYWCDKLGILVWQDMPSGDKYIGGNMPDIDKSGEAKEQFEFELTKLIETRFNHPSIIIWVPFNEGWGQYETGRVTDLIKNLDTTRLVNSASGWTDRGTGDILDIHNYPDPRSPEPEEGRAIVLGEFGGLGLPVKDHTWEQKNWGYENMIDSDELLSRYEDYYSSVYKMIHDQGLSATIYTQTTDVETETNGLMTYDRKVDKMGYEFVSKANRGILPPLLKNESRIFIDKYIAEFECIKKDCKIYYTVDGTLPDESSLPYSGPFELDSTTKVMAITYIDGESSRIRSYEIKKTEIILATDLTDPQPGLMFNVYKGRWTEMPEFSEERIVRSGLTSSVSISVDSSDSNLGLVFEGYLLIPETGVYGLFLNSDDGSLLNLNDNKIIDNDGIHGMESKGSYQPLGKGYHKIRIEYFQGGGGMGLEFYIQPPGEEKRIASKEYLAH